jgi:hypothetical protein
MSRARVKLPEHLLDLPRSKWEKLIDEYIKDEDDRYIATRYYLDGICLIDIAEELVGEEDKPKSLSYMKRHKEKILKIISRHLNEL